MGLPVTSILLGYEVDGLMGQVWYLVVWYYNWMVMVMMMEPLLVQFVLVVTAREIKLHCVIDLLSFLSDVIISTGWILLPLKRQNIFVLCCPLSSVYPVSCCITGSYWTVL